MTREELLERVSALSHGTVIDSSVVFHLFESSVNHSNVKMSRNVFISSKDSITVRYVYNGSEVKRVVNLVTVVPMIPRIGEHVMLDIGHGGISRKLVVTDVVYEKHNDIVLLVDYETGTSQKTRI